MLYKREYIENNKKLKEENKRLNAIINKAIEYIESKKYWFCDDYDLREEDGKNILDILKGVDKE